MQIADGEKYLWKQYGNIEGYLKDIRLNADTAGKLETYRAFLNVTLNQK